MKKLCALLLCVSALFSNIMAQDSVYFDKQEVQDFVAQKPDAMPNFPGGMMELYKFIGQNIYYPREAQEKGIAGQVIVKFIVDKQGRVKDPEIVHSVHPSLDAVALEVVEKFPDFIPAIQKGEPVSVYFSLPISFKLTD
ncbi:MAG: energy transducer TonB [Bacteroidales bacterium]|jgi:protein TonB|nr:energy transducer TonB [Bacteroidales bacterium]